MLPEITGNPNVGFNEEDIEGDFDPKKYDEAMQVSSSYKTLTSMTFLLSYHALVVVVLLSCYRKHSIRITTMKVKMKSQFLKMTWMKSWVGSQTVHTDIRLI